VTPQSASARGKANNAKGKKAERDIARWLREHGFGVAERTIRTGYSTKDRRSSDTGDVSTIGVCWQVKDVAEREWYRVPEWLDDTAHQRVACAADLGILVMKRHGHADPGRWWAWLPLNAIVTDTLNAAIPSVYDVPVRFALADLVSILRTLGYGTEQPT
jgi:hypothetical protein